MNGIVLTNGYYTNPRQEYQVARLMDEGARLGVALTHQKNNAPVVTGVGFDTDFVLFLDKDIALCENLEAAGVPCFNSAYGLRMADDKALSAVFFAQQGIATPKTICAPKCYRTCEDPEYLAQVWSAFCGAPVVVKERESSLGMGVYRAESQEELVRIVQKIGTTPHLFQQDVVESRGASRRIFVAGGQVVGAMALKNALDFRSNAELGGVASQYIPTDEEAQCALKIAKGLHLTFAGIDFFCTATPMAIEVNSNAYFSKFESVCGKNAAAAILNAILNAANSGAFNTN